MSRSVRSLCTRFQAFRVALAPILEEGPQICFDEANLMQRFRIIVISLLVASCTSNRNRFPQTSSFIYPTSCFVSEGTDRLLDQFVHLNVSTNQLGEFYRPIQNREEFERSLADPFVSESLFTVRFQSFDSASDIAAYYKQIFRTSGWQEKRGILAIEYTNCGGDWLRVYERSSAQVLVHICGSWEKLPEESDKVQVSRSITFKLRHLSPAELFGENYHRKGEQTSNKLM